MSSEITKENVITNKKEAIKSLNKLLEYYINDPSGKHLKKANLISYWIKDYTRFINFEESFEPTRNTEIKQCCRNHAGFCACIFPISLPI